MSRMKIRFCVQEVVRLHDVYLRFWSTYAPDRSRVYYYQFQVAISNVEDSVNNWQSKQFIKFFKKIEKN